MFEQVRDIIVDCMGSRLRIPAADLTTETTFLGQLRADSIDIANIISDIEEAFQIEIDNDDLEGIETIGDVIDRIQAKR